MKIIYTEIDKGGKNLEKELLQHAVREEERILERLARIAEQAIKEHIRAGLRKPEYSSGNLERNFYAHKFSEGGLYGWAIGDIAELNEKANYWRHINYGSEEIGANWQHVLPKGYWVDGMWVEDSDRGFFTTPETPIEARDYIEKTLLDLESAIQRVLLER
jgi:hypothetical protein